MITDEHIREEILSSLRRDAEGLGSVPHAAAVADDLERAWADCDLLPRFADDVLAEPGASGWFPGINEPGIVGETGFTCGNDDWGAGTDECYSTPKAAAKAKGAKP